MTYEEFFSKCKPGDVVFEVYNEQIDNLILTSVRKLVDGVYECNFKGLEHTYLIAYEGDSYCKYHDILDLANCKGVGYRSVICLTKEDALEELHVGLSRRKSKLNATIAAMQKELEYTIGKSLKIESYKDRRKNLIWAIENNGKVTINHYWEKYFVELYTPNGRIALAGFKKRERALRYAHNFKLDIV